MVTQDRARDWCIGITVFAAYFSMPFFFLISGMLFGPYQWELHAWMISIAVIALILLIILLNSATYFAWSRYNKGEYQKVRRLTLIPVSIVITLIGMFGFMMFSSAG